MTGERRDVVPRPATLAGMTLEMENCDIDLEDYAGTWRLLFVFAPDCGVCIRTARQLKVFRESLQKELHFFGVMLNPAAPLDLPSFTEKVGDLDFPLGYCPPGRFNAALGLPKGQWVAFPTLILLRPDNVAPYMLTPDNPVFLGDASGVGAEIRKLL